MSMDATHAGRDRKLATMTAEDRHKTYAHPKLSAESVREIRRRRDAGEKGKDLAREYGVAESVISRVWHRTNWKHVDYIDPHGGPQEAA